MRYLYVLLLALAVGPLSEVAAKGWDGANTGGGQVQGSRWYPDSGPSTTCCADVELIKLGLDSPDPGTVDAANQALKKKLDQQLEE